ncbi:MAG: hypothetical protein AAFX87_14160 [Bacteroidota bacterium]
MKHILVSFICSIILISCSNEHKTIDHIELTKAYYSAKGESDFQKLSPMYLDSIRVSEGEYDMVYSVEDFHKWVAWDSVFKPSYKILEIKSQDSIVEINVAKDCIRTRFLNEEPTVSKEILTFSGDKIVNLEIAEYISFNEEKWVTNREKLVSWVAENHPKLNGFIYDQTKTGGLNYLKAMELYQASQ